MDADFFKECDLDPELRPYLNKLGRFEALQHPLVYGVPYFPIQNNFYNEHFKFKKQALKKAEDEKDWSSFIFLHERPYRFSAFLQIQYQLKPQYYWPLVRQIWEDSENIWQNINVWRHIFKSEERAEYRSLMMHSFERRKLREYPDQLTLYRGTAVSFAGSISGLSWTLDYEKAVWFANRLRRAEEKAIVYKKHIHKKDVLAIILTRNEDEIITLKKGSVRVEPILQPK